jgi:hypothetical protein
MGRYVPISLRPDLALEGRADLHDKSRLRPPAESQKGGGWSSCKLQELVGWLKEQHQHVNCTALPREHHIGPRLSVSINQIQADSPEYQRLFHHF